MENLGLLGLRYMVVSFLSLFFLLSPALAKFSDNNGRNPQVHNWSLEKKEENAIEFGRATGADAVMRWAGPSVWDFGKKGKEYWDNLFQIYSKEKIQYVPIPCALEMGKHKGGYFSSHPDQYQCSYNWKIIKADKAEVLNVELPKNADLSNLNYWVVKDTTDVLIPADVLSSVPPSRYKPLSPTTIYNINYEKLKRARKLRYKAEWGIKDEKLWIKGEAGHTYTAFILQKLDMISPSFLGSTEYVAQVLDEFFRDYKPEISLIAWENLCGFAYQGDFCPNMQKMFKRDTGLEFDPQLVEYDPILWHKWYTFMAKVLADRIKLINEVLHKYDISSGFYYGDGVGGWSPDYLAKYAGASSDYYYGWTSSWAGGNWEAGGLPDFDWGWEYYWFMTFWGDWEDKPGSWLTYHPSNINYYSRLLSDNYETMTKWYWHILWRGAINQSLPDVLDFASGWSFDEQKEQTLAMHDISYQYKYIYNLLKQYTPYKLGNVYIPSLGPSWYAPSIFSLFTRQGFLWDAPFNYKHIDLMDIAKGEIPKDCTILVIPSEPFMSGLIDKKAVRKLEKYVKKGGALLVLRAAASTDIYGKDKGYTPLRELTGVDYKKAKKTRDCIFKRTVEGKNYWITKDLPGNWSEINNRKYVVQYRPGQYSYFRKYWLPHAPSYVTSLKNCWNMLYQLLPEWDEYPEEGARIYGRDLQVLYADGDIPMLAVRELGKGRIAYLAKEYDLPRSFGHPLLTKIVYWLVKKENIPLTADNDQIDKSFYYNKNKEVIVTTYNPLPPNKKGVYKEVVPLSEDINYESKPITANIRLDHFPDKERYVVLNLNPINPVNSEFIKNDKTYSWTGKDLKKDGYQISFQPWDLGLQMIRPYSNALLSDHAFLISDKKTKGFSSFEVLFKRVEFKDKILKITIVLNDPRPKKLTLTRTKETIIFPKEVIRIELPADTEIEIYYEGKKAVTCNKKGKINFINSELKKVLRLRPVYHLLLKKTPEVLRPKVFAPVP